MLRMFVLKPLGVPYSKSDSSV